MMKNHKIILKLSIERQQVRVRAVVRFIDKLKYYLFNITIGETQNATYHFLRFASISAIWS